MKTVKVDGSRVMPCARTLGVILAGGMSTRMGRNKALLPFRGKRLIDHIAQVLSERVGAENIYVSGDIEGYPCVLDVEKGKGPLAGLLSVAEKFPERWLLFVPVDMGALNAETLGQLLTARDLQPDGHAFHFESQELPILFRSTTVVRALLRELMNPHASPSMRSVREFAKCVGSVLLPKPIEADFRFLNTNTPQEWLSFHEEVRAHEYKMG